MPPYHDPSPGLCNTCVMVAQNECSSPRGRKIENIFSEDLVLWTIACYACESVRAAAESLGPHSAPLLSSAAVDAVFPREDSQRELARGGTRPPISQTLLTVSRAAIRRHPRPSSKTRCRPSPVPGRYV